MRCLHNVEFWLHNVNQWCLAPHTAHGNYRTTVQTKRHHISGEQEGEANNRLKVILVDRDEVGCPPAAQRPLSVIYR